LNSTAPVIGSPRRAHPDISRQFWRLPSRIELLQDANGLLFGKPPFFVSESPLNYLI
jgi:hypothetical protein